MLTPHAFQRPGRALLLSLLLVLVASSASATNRNLVELAQDRPELSRLVEAVIHAGLTNTVATADELTIFAPHNEAFDALLADLGLTSVRQVDPVVLGGILLDHVVDDRLLGRNIWFLARFDKSVASLGGLSLDFDRRPLEVNDVDIVERDLQASNGVIHVIDEVLVESDSRPSIVDLAVATPELSILTEAVVRVGLTTVLDAGGPFTVFAPTDDAFLDLLADLGAASLDDIDDGTLVNILLDHVVAGEFDLEELDGTRRALGGLKLNFRGRPRTVNGNAIVIPDVEASNGTVHVIDGVLLGRD